MEVILLEKIANLGNLGEKVTVKPGYGRNYLLPQRKAVLATPERLAEFEQRKTELEKEAAETLTAAEARREAIGQLTITITQKAGEEGRLYGSVGAQNIADAITQAGVEVKKQEVRLPQGPIRQTGDYEVPLHLHADVIAAAKVKVVPE